MFWETEKNKDFFLHLKQKSQKKFSQKVLNEIKNLAEKNNIAFSELRGNHVTPLLDASWVAPTIKWIEEK